MSPFLYASSRAFVVLLLAAVTALSACQITDPESPGSAGKTLSGKTLQGRWQILEIDGASVPSESRAFVEFSSPPRLTGNGGCNRFFGVYRYDDRILDVDEAVGSTKMACEATVMTQEQHLFETLPEATSVVLVDGRLHLLDPDGKVVIRADRLDGKDDSL